MAVYVVISILFALFTLCLPEGKLANILMVLNFINFIPLFFAILSVG